MTRRWGNGQRVEPHDVARYAAQRPDRITSAPVETILPLNADLLNTARISSHIFGPFVE